jgi:hypothetical protein
MRDIKAHMVAGHVTVDYPDLFQMIVGEKLTMVISTEGMIAGHVTVDYPDLFQMIV